MAKALLDKKLYEGTIFHCYHAFEAMCSAAIANQGQPVPKQHRSKFNSFLQLYPDLSFAQEFAALLAELYPKRERSLYADIEFGAVTDPSLAYSRQDAEQTLARLGGWSPKSRHCWHELYLIVFHGEARDWVDDTRIGYDKTGTAITTGFEPQWQTIKSLYVRGQTCWPKQRTVSQRSWRVYSPF
jgi:HEPN domain-containing protein